MARRAGCSPAPRAAPSPGRTPRAPLGPVALDGRRCDGRHRGLLDDLWCRLARGGLADGRLACGRLACGGLVDRARWLRRLGGVVGGDGRLCRWRGVVGGGGRLIGRCGVVGGDGRLCRWRGVVGGGGRLIGRCGVVGGDGRLGRWRGVVGGGGRLIGRCGVVGGGGRLIGRCGVVGRDGRLIRCGRVLTGADPPAVGSWSGSGAASVAPPIGCSATGSARQAWRRLLGGRRRIVDRAPAR